MKNIVKWMLAVTLVCAPALALAHTGAGDAHAHAGFMAGLVHPFTGLDHMAAMLAVGVWSALAVRPAWLAPVVFVALLLAGALAAVAGLVVPAVEPMIAASLVALGLLVALRARLPWGLAVAITGLFAFFHGAAHGSELAGDTGAWAALLGMVIGTAVLHVGGMGFGGWLRGKQRILAAAAGAAVALLGSALLLRMAM